MAKLILSLVSVLVVTLGLQADVESGPKTGEKVAELKVHAVIGPIEDKEVDYAAERKDAPTVYLFVNAEQLTRPTARFIKNLDTQLGEIGGEVAAVAVWVGGEFEKNKEFLPRANRSLQFANTALTVYDGDASGPNGWGVNSEAHLTVVVVNMGQVAKSFGFVSVNETDVRPIVAELKKVIKE